MPGSKTSRTLAIVLLVIGVVLIAVGVMYFTVAADKLPSLLGPLHHVQSHRTKRGAVALVLGGLSAIGAIVAFVRSR
jgi:flagellar basal body-associated protein FliL